MPKGYTFDKKSADRIGQVVRAKEAEGFAVAHNPMRPKGTQNYDELPPGDHDYQVARWDDTNKLWIADWVRFHE